MPKKSWVVLIAFGLLVWFLISMGYSKEEKPLFQLTIKANKQEYQLGEDIRIVFLIKNNSDRDIYLEGFSLEPNSQNSEVFNCDIFGKRNGVTFSFQKPEINIPISVSGPRRWIIHKGEALEIMQQFNKWKTPGGISVSKLRGIYELEGKLTNISLDTFTKIILFSRNKIKITVVQAKE